MRNRIQGASPSDLEGLRRGDVADFLAHTILKLVVANLIRHSKHLKEDIIRKEKTNQTRGNNLKNLTSIFQDVIRFYPRHLEPNTLVNSFSVLI